MKVVLENGSMIGNAEEHKELGDETAKFSFLAKSALCIDACNPPCIAFTRFASFNFTIASNYTNSGLYDFEGRCGATQR